MAAEVVVDRAIIEMLLRSADAQANLPVIRGAATKKTAQKAGCCQGSNRTPTYDIRGIKFALMGLPVAQMTWLKGFLRTQTLVFHTPSPQGVATTKV